MKIDVANAHVRHACGLQAGNQNTGAKIRQGVRGRGFETGGDKMHE